jgi:RAP1 GTPase activating protein 1
MADRPPTTLVVHVGEKKFKHKSGAADTQALARELSAKFNAPTLTALALWSDALGAYRRPVRDADWLSLPPAAVLKVRLTDAKLAYADVVDESVARGDSGGGSSGGGRNRSGGRSSLHFGDDTAPLSGIDGDNDDANDDANDDDANDDDANDDASGDLDSHQSRLSATITRRLIETEQTRQVFVLRTFYEYAASSGEDDSASSTGAPIAAAAAADTAVVAEELYGLCKLQLHPRNFKALRATAASDAVTPLVSLLGPTAGGKTALLREFAPDVQPVVGFSGQPLPTTSNVNYLRAADASLRFLDMEGEDGGLPLTQVYTGARVGAAAAAERDKAIEVDDALRATRDVMAQLDQKQLERYMEARRSATRDALPRLAYVLSDVVVYVEAADTAEAAVDVSKLFARVALFANSCTAAVVSAMPPALVVVQTQCPVRSAAKALSSVAAASLALGAVDFDTETASAALRAADTMRLLADTFASVHVVRVPDVERQQLYETQVAGLQALVRTLGARSLEARAQRGLQLSERGWFDVAADVVRSWNTPSLAVGQFLQRHSAVPVDLKSRIAGRAFEFFHRVYHTPETEWFVRCRHAAVRVCAIECVAAVVEDECSLLDAATFNDAFDVLLRRIDSRAPCQYALDHVRCRDERLTHGAVHRLEQSTSRIEDAFRFVDATSVDDLRAAFAETLRSAAKAQRRHSSAVGVHQLTRNQDRSSLLAQRLSIYRDVVTVEAASPLEDKTCWVCLRRPPTTLLTSLQSVCTPCFAELQLSSATGVTTGGVTCPVRHVPVERVPPRPDWRGRRGVRALALDGATLGDAQSAANLLKRLEDQSGVSVAHLFDVIGGVSLGGLLAIVVGICNTSAAKAAALVEQLRAAATTRPTALLLEYPLESTVRDGDRVWIPATVFDQLLRAATHDDKVGWSELLDSAVANRSPKVFAATSDAAVDGVYLFSNYPQGDRHTSTVDCSSLTAWEAARACSATLDAYENNARVFVDAALSGAPSAEALVADETLLLSDFARTVDVFVSINAGRASGGAPNNSFLTVDALRAAPGVYRKLVGSSAPARLSKEASASSLKLSKELSSGSLLSAPQSAAPAPPAPEKLASKRRASEKAPAADSSLTKSPPRHKSSSKEEGAAASPRPTRRPSEKQSLRDGDDAGALARKRSTLTSESLGSGRRKSEKQILVESPPRDEPSVSLSSSSSARKHATLKSESARDSPRSLRRASEKQLADAPAHIEPATSHRRHRATDDDTLQKLSQRLVALTYHAESQGAFETLCGVSSHFIVRSAAPRLRADKVEMCAWILSADDDGAHAAVPTERLSRRSALYAQLVGADADADVGGLGDKIRAPLFLCQYAIESSGLHRIAVKVRVLEGDLHDSSSPGSPTSPDGENGWWHVSGSPFVVQAHADQAVLGPLASAALLDLADLVGRVPCVNGMSFDAGPKDAPVPSADEMLLLRESANRAVSRLRALRLTLPAALSSCAPADWVRWRAELADSLYCACVPQLGIGPIDASDAGAMRAAIDFVRRRVVTWLTLHGDVRIGSYALRSLVEVRGGRRWSDYLARVALPQSPGDLFVLFAISESFGLPLVLVTGAGASGEAYLLSHVPQAVLRVAPIGLVHWNEANFAALARDDLDRIARFADASVGLLSVAFAEEYSAEQAAVRARQQRRQAAIDGAAEAVEKAAELAAAVRASLASETAAIEAAASSVNIRQSPPSTRSPLVAVRSHKARSLSATDKSSDTESSSSTQPALAAAAAAAAASQPRPRESPEPRPSSASSSSSSTAYRSMRDSGASQSELPSSARRSTLRAKPTHELAESASTSPRRRHRRPAADAATNNSQDDGSDSAPRSSRARNDSGSSDRGMLSHSAVAALNSERSETPPDSPSGRRKSAPGNADAADAARSRAHLASALRSLPSLAVDVVRSAGGHVDVSSNALALLPAAITPLAPIVYSLDARYNEIDTLMSVSVRVAGAADSPREASPRSSDEGSPKLAHVRRSPARTSPRLRAAVVGGASLAQFTGLRTLLLAHNRIAVLPASLFDALQALEVLDLSYNRLTALPTSIGELAALRQLNVAHNKLDHLPPQLVNLDALALLDVSFNALQMFPAFIADLESLAVLRTEGNPLLDKHMQTLFCGSTGSVVQFLDANKRALRKLHRMSSSNKIFEAKLERAASVQTQLSVASSATDIGDLLRSEAMTASASPAPASPASSTSSAKSSGLSLSAKVSRATIAADDGSTSPLSLSARTPKTQAAADEVVAAPAQAPRGLQSPTNKQVALVRTTTGRRNSLSRSMASMLNMMPTAEALSQDGSSSGGGSPVPASPIALLRAEKSARRLSLDPVRMQSLEFDDGAAAAAPSTDFEAIAAAAQVALINSELMRYVLPRDTATSKSKGSRLGKRASRRVSALELSDAGAGGGASNSAAAAVERATSAGVGLRRNLLLSAHQTSTHASVSQALSGEGEDAGEEAVLEEGKFVPLVDFDNYFEREHVSFLGTDAGGHSIVLSALRERVASASTYRALLRTEEGDERLWLPADMIKVDGKNRLARPKDLLAAATRLRPELLQGAQLKAYKDARVPAELMAFENSLRMKGYKFGVVFAKDGQATEDDALANESGSERFDEFLALLGKTIALAGWQRYRAGLDVATNSTGTHSVYTTFQDCEVMFHVSTMLPMQPCREGERVQQLARKRHIGNDIVVIVFQDGTTPFDVSSVASEFNHVWFVVQPLKMAGQTHFRLTIACKNGVGDFGPPFSHSVHANDAAFRSFLLAKLINAERAAYQAPGFAKPIRRSRQILLDALVESVRNISKSAD